MLVSTIKARMMYLNQFEISSLIIHFLNLFSSLKMKRDLFPPNLVDFKGSSYIFYFLALLAKSPTSPYCPTSTTEFLSEFRPSRSGSLFATK